MKEVHNDFFDEYAEYEKLIEQMSPEKRVRLIIDGFFKMKCPDSMLIDNFVIWLNAPKDIEIKDRIMLEKFEELL